MALINCNNCGNQVNSDDNICQYCGNHLYQNISNINNQENGIKQKKIPNIFKVGMYICIGFVLGITPFLLKEIKQLDKSNQENNTIVEDIEIEDKVDNVIDNKQDEEIINDEQEIDTDIKEETQKEEQNKENNQQQNSSSNNSNSSNNNITSSNSSNSTTNNEEVSKKESIIGTWLYEDDDEKIVFIFTDDKFTTITPKMNTMSEQNYRIDENRIILNEKEFVQYEIKDGILFWGIRAMLKKQDANFVYPSIYYNRNVFYGTWKLESDKKTIILENGAEKTLDDEIIITSGNTSGFGSCGGSGCNSIIVNFNNSKPELYTGNLCYELVDNNTFKQIKCHSDTIKGYSQWEDETLHNITYKKVN